MQKSKKTCKTHKTSASSSKLTSRELSAHNSFGEAILDFLDPQQTWSRLPVLPVVIPADLFLNRQHLDDVIFRQNPQVLN